MVYMHCNRNEMIGILAIVQQLQMHAVQWYKPRSCAFGFNKVLMGHLLRMAQYQFQIRNHGYKPCYKHIIMSPVTE